MARKAVDADFGYLQNQRYVLHDALNAGQLASQPGGYLIEACGKRRKGRGHAAVETGEQHRAPSFSLPLH